MSRKKILWIIIGIVILIIVILGGSWLAATISNEREYNEKEYPGETEYYSDEAYPEEMLAPGMDKTAPTAKTKPAKTAAGDSQQMEGEQKIIKTADLALVVKKVDEAVVKITNLIIAKKGFVSDSKVYTREDKTQYGAIVVRVPVQDFESTINGLKELAEIVEKENISGLDVTEEYVDLQSRLKNLKIEEGQYQKILQTAKEIEDILKVTEYLFNVRENIERLEGRIKYLEDLTDLATIRISLSEEPRVEVPTPAWRPWSTIKRAFRSMIIFLQGLTTLLIWVLFHLVPIGIVALIVIKIVKTIKKKIAKRKQEEEVEQK